MHIIYLYFANSVFCFANKQIFCIFTKSLNDVTLSLQLPAGR